ncbi:cation-independent mannose-6-phosphate receptor [Anopheles cruzii]|uniref:cation-independent mannose-6-phosphate receptor n=1 Tax=Anopheles cruzii TaxID=68878 RepID=UPI0022EC74A1|nr:cation-independent mannose-6-phosphate receptor [Anopheles cruzii]
MMENNVSEGGRKWKMMARVATLVTALLLLELLTVSVPTAGSVPVGSSKLLVNGTDCTLVEPMYNVTFDFHDLSSDLSHHVISDRNERFVFNVCGERRPSAYLIRPTGNTTLGDTADLRLEDGRLQFSFVGDPCGASGQRYSLDLILLCSYDRASSELSVIPYSSDQCRYFIFWTTPHACLPLPKELRDAHCTATDTATGHTYNLSPLANVNHLVADGRGSDFLVAACRPVHYGHLAMCPPGSGVCFVNATEPDIRQRYRDYGQMVANPVLKDGQLVMELRSATQQCGDSRIVFECGVELGNEGPQYVGKKGCTYQFRWSTSLACARSQRPCSVSNPTSGTVHDLGSLAERVYVLAEANRTYEVAVCRMPQTATWCPSGSGACEVSGAQSVSFGAVNDELQFGTTGAPYLLYRSGAMCRGDQRWTTKLEFICETDSTEPDGGMVAPRVVESGEAANCQMVVQFETVLVCEPAMKCLAFNRTTDEYIDLTPLANSVANYEARLGSTVNASTAAVAAHRKYFLNVCRPLVPQYGLSCRGGASACEAIFDGTTFRNETTLGFPDISLMVADDAVLMRYLRGDRCTNDPHTNSSSTVAFRCSPKAGFGQPELREIEPDCHYRFDWDTAIVCPPTTAIRFEKSNCSFTNDATGGCLSLKEALESDTANNSLYLDAFCSGQHDGFGAWLDYSLGALRLSTSAALAVGSTSGKS